MNKVFSEAKKLSSLGWGLHWLKTKSKRPIDTNWTKRKKDSWTELETKYRDGMNLGVRLGKVSRPTPNTFLAVLDCDVKSEEPADRKELEAKLKELFPKVDFKNVPTVLSGRGNGSRHIYVQTSHPAEPKILARSNKKVKVLMPSAFNASSFDKEVLSEKEIAAGYRMRPAWEIGLMGEGQQVVLPPSTHPDTGKRYSWAKELTPKELAALPLVASTMKKEEKHEDVKAKIIEAVDFVNSELSDKTVDLILTGEGASGDKSADLFSAMLAMCRAGFTDDEILTVLTDKDNYLGDVAYRHAQTSKRERAMHWLRRYSLKKAREATDVVSDFEGVEANASEEVNLSSPKVREQNDALLKDHDWREDIERTSEKDGARPKNTVKNVVLILANELGTNLFIRDDFSGFELFGRSVQFKTSKVVANTEIRDVHIAEIKYWLSSYYRFEPSDNIINDAIKVMCAGNSFHPVRDYLATLEWDGKPRLDTWLRDYLGAIGPKEYLSAVGRKVLCAMIARIYHPGTKFDYMLILEGKQGIGKSSVVRELASPQWFTDTILDMKDKDSVLTMRSMWIVEIGELASLKLADLETLKSFITRTVDRIRAPYGKKTENIARQCIFIGTTNSHEYLRDPSGNRRFWPVRIGISGPCDFEKMARDRDQLLAEAILAFELGEPLYLESTELQEQASREQEKRFEEDPFEEKIYRFFISPENVKNKDWDEFHITKLFDFGGPLEGQKEDRGSIQRSAGVLRRLGFKNLRKRNCGKVERLWARNEL